MNSWSVNVDPARLVADCSLKGQESGSGERSLANSVWNEESQAHRYAVTIELSQIRPPDRPVAWILTTSIPSNHLTCISSMMATETATFPFEDIQALL